MDAVTNFRELGGLPVAGGARVRPGLFFRSGHWALASDADLDQMEAAGIRTVVDLRNDDDIESEGRDRLPDGVEHVHLGTDDSAGRSLDIRELLASGTVEDAHHVLGDGQSAVLAAEGSIKYLVDDHQVRRFRAVLEVVTDPAAWPVLWHCSAGKDRAGWTATSMLMALGADDATIVDHYVESNQRRKFWGDPGTVDDGLYELIEPFINVRAEYVQGQLATVEEHWGGRVGLLRDAFGHTDESLTELRTEATEPHSP